MFRLILAIFMGVALAEKHYYHTYDGTVLTDEEYQEYVDAGSAPFCVIEVEDCDPNEGRRTDATCNNLKYPSKGAAHTPFSRLLEHNYVDGDQPRLTYNGEPLPPTRLVRTKLMPTGKVKSTTHSNLITTWWVFSGGDFEFAQDVSNYLDSKPGCCESQSGNLAERCFPLEIPSDDQTHRFSGIRCTNMTVPITYQNTGCIANGTAPERTDVQTPLMDLSMVYGSDGNAQREKLRMYEGGLIKHEIVDGEEWPLSDPSTGACRANNQPEEIRCHDTPDLTMNGILGQNLCGVWYWRQHNRFARQLAEVNPCWDDDKLFTVARELNIATYQNIIMYELYPALFGKENMIRDGLIQEDKGYRDLYDEEMYPHQTIEFLNAVRWAHTMQEGTLHLYDEYDNYLHDFPIVNASFNTGYLTIDQNMVKITRGLIRQPSAEANDVVVDPDIAETAAGNLMTTLDLMTNDAMKSRMFGLQPYIKYREHCTGNPHTTWEDLTSAIPKERIELMKEVYPAVETVDFLAGEWMETAIEGGWVPSTLYCVGSDQLRRTMKGDRHWFERQNRPNAFTEEQLCAVREFTAATMLCNNAGITKVQPNVFFLPGEGNEVGTCEEVAKDIDISLFKDPACASE